MKNKLLIFAFVAQFLLIGGVFVNAYLPVLLGVEVKVRAFGYDPRDILAGNFVRLNYGLRLSNDESIAMQGKEIYISLESSGDISKFGKISLQKPKDGLFIKAKQTYKYSSELKIGAEKYFASKERALEIERKLREIPRSSDGENQNFIAIATLKIYNGKARIVDLQIIAIPNGVENSRD